MRDLLIAQISEELANGKTDTLNEILVNELDDKQVLSRLTKESLAILEERKPNFELKGGMLIRAKVDLKGTSNCYNTPETIDIPKGTILRLPSEGTNRGDVFCRVVEGECIVHCRSLYSTPTQPTRAIKGGDTYSVVGLQQGVKTRCPYDLGLADKNFWEKVQ